MAIKTYKKGSNEQLSKNFQAREFYVVPADRVS
jgi:hypothetical protein